MQLSSDSLALSEANDWDHDKQRLWREKEESGEEGKPSEGRRTSVTSELECSRRASRECNVFRLFMSL